MNKSENLDGIKKLIEECIKSQKLDFIANLIQTLQINYIELAQLCTDGNYHEGWSHSKVIDYITYES